MRLSMIVAVAKNGVIGNKQQIPWHLAEDLKFFKYKTLNHVIIMGRKTFESLPYILPKRHHIVLSHSKALSSNQETVTFCQSITQAIELCKKLPLKYQSSNEIFIIGGAKLYQQALPLAHRLYLTKIDQNYEGDTWFPEYDKNQWITVSSRYYERVGDNPAYRFTTLDNQLRPYHDRSQQ